MKKFLVLLTVVATALVFSTGALADPCSTCKCPMRNIPCPTGGQIAAACAEFDYDGTPGVVGSLGFGYGYCSATAPPNNCRAILHVCECLPDPTAFVTSLDVGVEMDLMVNGVEATANSGVYWSNTLAAAAINIPFATQATQALACAIASYGALGVSPFPSGTAMSINNFGTVTFYQADKVTPVATAALPANPTCTVAAAARSTHLEAHNTSAVSGFLGKLSGAEGEWWWLDIPPMRIDPTLIAAGAVISVKVTLTQDAAATICGSCTLCECIIPIATVCCAAAAPVTNLTLPYLPANTAYWRGFAVINPLGTSTGTVTLTLVDVNGNTATATVSVPAGGMFSDLIDNLSWTTTSANLAGKCYIRLAANYGGAQAFVMFGDGNQGLGYIVTPPGTL